VTQNTWDKQKYHGRYNKYPFTEVVSFVMQKFGAAPDKSEVRILDLGFGGAHHLMFLAQEGFNFYGIDGSEESLGIARERLGKAGYKTDTLAVGQFDKTPYPDNFFDCVIDRGSLTCNRLADLPPLFEETRRILKPGGYFFSWILHEMSTNKDSARSLGNNDFSDFPGRLSGAGVIHYTNAEEMRDLCKKFTIEDIEIQIRKSQYPASANNSIAAVMLTTCRK